MIEKFKENQESLSRGGDVMIISPIVNMINIDHNRQIVHSTSSPIAQENKSPINLLPNIKQGTVASNLNRNFPESNQVATQYNPTRLTASSNEMDHHQSSFFTIPIK